MAPKKEIAIPTILKCLYTTYEVVVTNINEHNVEPDTPLYGKVDWEKQIIYMEETQSDDMMKETLWHEVKHLAWSLCGLPKSLYLTGVVGEEDIVARLSTIETTIMKDNPKLMDYILS